MDMRNLVTILELHGGKFEVESNNSIVFTVPDVPVLPSMLNELSTRTSELLQFLRERDKNFPHPDPFFEEFDACRKRMAAAGPPSDLLQVLKHKQPALHSVIADALPQTVQRLWEIGDFEEFVKALVALEQEHARAVSAYYGGN